MGAVMFTVTRAPTTASFTVTVGPGINGIITPTGGISTLTIVDNGDGTYTASGPSVVDNGDGTYTITDTAVTLNGDGTYTITS